MSTCCSFSVSAGNRSYVPASMKTAGVAAACRISVPRRGCVRCGQTVVYAASLHEQPAWGSGVQRRMLEASRSKFKEMVCIAKLKLK